MLHDPLRTENPIEKTEVYKIYVSMLNCEVDSLLECRHRNPSYKSYATRQHLLLCHLLETYPTAIHLMLEPFLSGGMGSDAVAELNGAMAAYAHGLLVLNVGSIDPRVGGNPFVFCDRRRSLAPGGGLGVGRASLCFVQRLFQGGI